MDEVHEYNSPILVAVTTKYRATIEEMLVERGFSSVVTLSDACIEEIRQLKYENNAYKPHQLLRFQVQVAEHCNLNCRGCAHFAPLAGEEFLDLKVYERDLNRLSKLFNHRCEWIHLMGGEPLLNPKLPVIMKMTREYFSEGNIFVVTNGILLPRMNEEFWEMCKECSVIIMPTRYPISVDYEAMKEKAGLYGVEYIYITKSVEDKTFTRFTLSENGGENVNLNYLNCKGANECITLRNGKLYTCVWPAHAHHLINYFNLKKMEVSPSDGVDIYNVNDAEEIMRRLSHPIPFCRYCCLDRQVQGIPFGISKKIKEEWLE